MSKLINSIVICSKDNISLTLPKEFHSWYMVATISDKLAGEPSELVFAEVNFKENPTLHHITTEYGNIVSGKEQLGTK